MTAKLEQRHSEAVVMFPQHTYSTYILTYTQTAHTVQSISAHKFEYSFVFLFQYFLLSPSVSRRRRHRSAFGDLPSEAVFAQQVGLPIVLPLWEAFGDLDLAEVLDALLQLFLDGHLGLLGRSLLAGGGGVARAGRQRAQQVALAP